MYIYIYTYNHIYVHKTSKYIIKIDQHVHPWLRDAAASAATSSKVRANFLAANFRVELVEGWETMVQSSNYGPIINHHQP